MGQIIGGAAKPKRCNLNQLSQVPTPAAGEYILVSSDNSMNAAGQGNFDCYIKGDGTTAATELELHKLKGEELEERLFGMPQKSIDLGTYQDYSCGMLANGKWYNDSTGYSHRVIPVIPREKYVVAAQSSIRTSYALLTSHPTPVNGQNIPLCSGCSVTEVLATKVSDTITIPSDCQFLAITNLNGGTSRLPQSVTRLGTTGALDSLHDELSAAIPQVVNNLVDGGATAALSAEMGKVLKESVVDITGKDAIVINFSLLASHSGVLLTSQQYWYLAANCTHVVIPVEAGDVYYLTANSTAAARYALVKSYTQPIKTGDTIDFCNNCAIVTQLNSQGEVEITIPSDCNYIIFNTSESGDNRVPSSFYRKATDGLLKGIQEELNKIDYEYEQEELEFASGYFYNSIVNPAPINTSMRRYTTNYIEGGFTIELKSNWYLRSVLKYDQYKNLIADTSYGSEYVGKVVIEDDGNTSFFRFDAQYTGDSYPTTVISPISSISYNKTKIDVAYNAANKKRLSGFSKIDLDFDFSETAESFPAQTKLSTCNALYGLWDTMIANYGGTKADTTTETGLSTPSYQTNPIYIYKFLCNKSRTDKSRHIKVLIYSGEHANEWFSHYALLGMMQHILSTWKTDHNSSQMLSLVDFYVMPCINPWGYDNGSRTNYNGVNINRNYAASNWREGTAGNDYGGQSAGSEFETKTVQWYVENIKPDVFMSIHTGGTNSYGSIGSLECSCNDVEYDKLDYYDFVSKVCRTSSNRDIIDNTNYPQRLTQALLDANVYTERDILASIDDPNYVYTGLCHMYAMEKGVKLPMLIELCMTSAWKNGIYNTSEQESADSSAVLSRANLLFLLNTVYRGVQAISETFV